VVTDPQGVGDRQQQDVLAGFGQGVRKRPAPAPDPMMITL